MLSITDLCVMFVIRYGHLGEVVGNPNHTQFRRGKGLDGPPVFATAMGLLVSWCIIWASMFAGYGWFFQS